MPALLLAFLTTLTLTAAQSTTTTLAGVPGTTGAADGPSAASTFFFPEGVACGSGGAVAVADTANGRLRIVDGGVTSTPSVTDSTGAPLPAQFTGSLLAVAMDGATVFLSTGTTHRLLALSTPANQLSLLAGTGSAGFRDDTGDKAAFNTPAGLAVLSNALFVADEQNNCIRAVSALGVATTVAGGGPGSVGSADGVGMSALFNKPRGIAAAGGVLYVADTGNSLIRSVSLADGAVATLAGSALAGCGFADGVGAAAAFCSPKGIAVAPDGGVLFVSDTQNNRLRRVVAATGETTTLAGRAAAGAANGAGTAAAFNQPGGLCATAGGALVVADRLNSCIRAIAVGTPTPTPSGSPSPTGSGTPSPSPSRSGTGSGTLSPTRTRSPSPSPSPQVCAPGSFLPPGAAACAACPRGAVQPAWGAPSACANCSGALRANPNATRCDSCERMTRPDASSQSCAPCRVGEFCDGNATTALPCTPAEACLAYGASAPCKAGYEGAACARCVARFFRASSGECVSCDTVNVAEWLGVTFPLWFAVGVTIVGSLFLTQQDIALHKLVKNAFGAYPQFLSVFFAHANRLILLYRLSALPLPTRFSGFLASVGQLGFSWESIAACRQDTWTFYSTWNLVVAAFAVCFFASLGVDALIGAGKLGYMMRDDVRQQLVYPFRSWRGFLFADHFFPSVLQVCFMAFAIAPDGKHLFYDPATPPRFEYFIFSALIIALATLFVLVRSTCVETRTETRAFLRNNGGTRCAPVGAQYETKWVRRLEVSRLLSIISRFTQFFLATSPLIVATWGPSQSLLWQFGCMGARSCLSVIAVVWTSCLEPLTPKQQLAIFGADLMPM